MRPRHRIRASARGFFALLIVLLGVAIGPPPARALPPTPCPGESPANTPLTGFHAGVRPVVFVHGFTGTGGSLHDTASGLISRLGQNVIQPLFFDYTAYDIDWVAVPGVASCLADYITAASAKYTAAGGDGKVIVVAHSMGGLATMFATDPRYAVDPVTGDELAGMITFDTPYRGSPFGNQRLSAAWARVAADLNGAFHPPSPGTSASRCLALHPELKYHGPTTGNGGLPSDCALAPYLPASVRLTEIAGDITVSRTVLGRHLYDIDMGSDGIVPTESSGGYLGGSLPPRPVGEKVDYEPVDCTVKSDAVSAAAVKLGARIDGITGGVVGALASVTTALEIDNFALDDILAGKASLKFIPLLASVYRAAPCSHSGVLTYPPALDAAANAIQADIDTLAPTTTPTPTGGSATELVVDVSGSMSESAGDVTKLEAAQQASDDVLQLIGAEQSLESAAVGVVTFSDGASVLATLSSDLTSPRDAIDGLQPEDQTNLGAGLKRGIAQLATSGASRTIILLSDGETNTGISRDDILSTVVPEAVTQHVKIDTVALGDSDVDTDLLQQIAAATGGSYSTATTLDQLRKDFVTNQQASHGVVIGSNTGSVSSGQLLDAPSIKVPYDQRLLEVSLAWDDGQVALHLTDPHGHLTVVHPTDTYTEGSSSSLSNGGPPDTTAGTAQTIDNGAVTIVPSNPEVVIVHNPSPGTWHVAVSGEDIPPGGTAYFTIASRQAGGHTPRPPAWHHAIVPLSVLLGILCVIGIGDAILLRRRAQPAEAA